MGDEHDPRVVSVLTEVAGLDRPFDYAVPAGFDGPLEVGSRVRVPLNGRSVRGWIVGEGQVREGTKPLARTLGIGPPAALIDLCEWAAWRWSTTTARLLGTASPDRIATRLPTPPPWRSTAMPTSELGTLGAELGATPGSTVVELGPATDPFDLILGLHHACSDALRERGSLLVIVPTLAYARRLVGRLGRRGVAAVDAADGWEAARAGWPVVVGTRAAAVAPVPTLAGVVVLDADDERLVAEGAPTWSAVDLAVERARRSAAPVLLVTSCPTPALAVLPARRGLGSAAIAAGWPRFVIADRRGADPRTGRYSEQMVAAAHRALAAQPDGVAVVCLLNRTGRARLLACRTCSAIARCEHCEAAVVADGDDLVCPRCATRRPVVCVGCGATAMKVLRAGTTQVAEEVGLLLGVPTAELTAKGEDIEGARCVVGTEAVLHRLRRTSLVVFLDIDATLLAPRAGAEIETLRQIGRAGRLVGGRGAGDGGVVMVQTRVGEHPVLAAAERGCVDEVVRDDVEIRAALRLPPTRACATIRGEGAGELAARLDGLGLEVRRLEDGRQVALADTTAALCDALAAAGRPKARVSVAVDQEPT